MKRGTTDIYPTRYAVADQPDTLVRFTPVDGMYRSCVAHNAPSPWTHLALTRTWPGELYCFAATTGPFEWGLEVRGKITEDGGDELYLVDAWVDALGRYYRRKLAPTESIDYVFTEVASWAEREIARLSPIVQVGWRITSNRSVTELTTASAVAQRVRVWDEVLHAAALAALASPTKQSECFANFNFVRLEVIPLASEEAGK